MKAFLVGFFLTLLIISGVAVYFLAPASRGPVSGVRPNQGAPGGLNQSSPKAGPGTGLAKVVSVGSVEVSPFLAARLASAKSVSVRMKIQQWEAGASIADVGGARFENPIFPLQYEIGWNDRVISAFSGAENLGTFVINVTICVDVPEEECKMSALPRFQGYTRMEIKVPGGLKESKGEVRLAAPRIFVNRAVELIGYGDCAKAGNRISGQIQPTDAFLSRLDHPKKFAVVGIPQTAREAPFFGKGARRPTRDEMKSISNRGVIYNVINLKGRDSVPFVLRVPKGKERITFTYFAVACEAKDSDEECASRFFPFPESMAMELPDRGFYKLMPKNFTYPACGGSNSIFYLHEWKGAPGTATMDSYHNANPPEVVEGIVF